MRLVNFDFTEVDSEIYQHLITKLSTHHFSLLHRCVLHTRKCFYAFKGRTRGVELFFKCKDELLARVKYFWGWVNFFWCGSKFVLRGLKSKDEKQVWSRLEFYNYLKSSWKIGCLKFGWKLECLSENCRKMEKLSSSKTYFHL